MNSLRNSFLNQRVPQVFGIFALISAIVAISYFSNNAVRSGTQAAIGDVPKSMQISNISDNSFTVSYLTDASVVGSVAYGKDTKLGSVAFDIRDNKTPAPHKVHYVKINSLTPSTKYFFSLISADSSSDKSVTHEVTTAPSSENNSENQLTVSGKITLADGSTPTEAIGYIQSDDSQLISSLISITGGYAFELKNVRSKDLTSILSFAENSLLNMTIMNSDAKSEVKFLSDQANPMPAIILSKNYDFSIDNQPLRTSTASESAQVTGFPTPEVSAQSNGPQILTPKSDQEFKDQQPLFEGKGQPESEIQITIESDPITATVQTDGNGKWEFRPDSPLTPGKHTITIKAFDAEGILKTITRSFTVFAEGSQFVEPSVSPTTVPSPTPTSAPASPTPTPTPSPAITAVPTPIIVTTVPSVATPTTPVAQITTPPIPNAGSSDLIFGFIGTVFAIGIGGLLFLLL